MRHPVLPAARQDRPRGDRRQSEAARRSPRSRSRPSNIDVAEATARRIPVTVVPPIATEATADINFGADARGRAPHGRGRPPGARRQVSRARSRAICSAPCVYGKTIGLVGGGGPHRPGGGARARAAFACACSTGRRGAMPEAEERERRPRPMCRSTSCSPNPISSRCTRRSTPADAAPDRRARAVGLMKPTAFLINTARGADRRRGGAGRGARRQGRSPAPASTCSSTSPRCRAALTSMPNVVLTPHLGSAVVEVREEMAEHRGRQHRWRCSTAGGRRTSSIRRCSDVMSPDPSSPSPTARSRRSIPPWPRWRSVDPEMRMAKSAGGRRHPRGRARCRRDARHLCQAARRAVARSSRAAR